MATELFGNHISPACKYCREGYPNGDNVLCRRRGLVAPDFRCRHFYYDPLIRVPKRPMPLEKFTADTFSLD